ncbi:hypothetical protein FEM48_Zijuj01G0268000 [Ziziphus jujuba var. spinosa]|uniref:Uncharacterized protein n=1 Tax=Ziziphus jujuba var. spinosa TaxID=714518 RepID=A0A978W536_ZIZJJ|nr:hypothetical protein FEM48_Zijuj01G0268000 [Ziziphus jujuba var. spinosa]
MERRCNSSSSLSSASSFGSCSALRAAIPKSPPPPPPPPGLDLYGKRRQMVKLQVLEREIGLLQLQIRLSLECPKSYTFKVFLRSSSGSDGTELKQCLHIEELKSLDGLQPASRSCRELDTFIGNRTVVNPITSGTGSGENVASILRGFAALVAACLIDVPAIRHQIPSSMVAIADA